MKNSAIQLIVISIVSITLTGCFSSWSKEEKQVLKMQAKSILGVMPMGILSMNKQLQFTECFEVYILKNYSGKEYMSDSQGPGLLAMMKCKKILTDLQE
jgi:hypothetical protein